MSRPLSHLPAALFTLTTIAITLGIGAQTPDPSELTPEQLLVQIAEESRMVTIASKKAVPPREAPGIVTVVTSDEIAASGARDLIDVLRQVPGLDFGLDVEGIVGLGVRGNWAHEGKVLMMVDGQELNEPLYTSLHFGNEFPVSLIERIEIVRGPGSAIYGGYAELAVINIVTKQADTLAGLEVTLTDGEMSGVNGRRRVDFGWGKVSGANRVSILGSLASGNRSDAIYTDLAGESYDMSDNAELGQQFFSVSMAHRNYEAKLIVDRYQTTERDEYGLNLERPADVDFNSIFFEATAVYELAPGLLLTPRVNLKRQEPWRQTSDATFIYDKTVDRYLGNVILNWEPTSALSVVAGAEYYRDHATTPESDDPDTLFGGVDTEVDYDDVALFAEAMTTTPVGLLSAAARWESHSEAGDSFVPRFALAKVIGKFHYKLLASRAFRAPSIENFSSSDGSLEPEETQAFEIEGGYRPSAGIELTANVFDTKIEKTIVYSYDAENGTEAYSNLGDVSTRGFEIEGRVRRDWGWANLSYSYYQNKDNEVEAYAVPQSDDALRAFPTDKIALAASLKLGQRASVSPSLVYYGRRFATGAAGEEGEPVVVEFDPVTLANVFVNFDDVGIEGFSVGAGVYDLFGENNVFLQPYEGEHLPLPDATREYVVRLSYKSR